MAIGSRLTTPAWPVAAAVVSDPFADALKTPCSQSKDSVTRGIVFDLLPPKRMPDMGTPLGLSTSGERPGQL